MALRETTRRAALALATCNLLALLPAQLAPPPQKPAPPPGEYVPIDRVESKVGDDAILMSRVRAMIAPDIRVKQQLKGGPLSASELNDYYQRGRGKLEDQYAMAQAAKTLGILPPDRIEALLQSRLDEAEAEEVRKFGTTARFAQALTRQNRTWESWRRDTRMQEELALTKELAVYGRLQNQANLFITPRMLRELYDYLKPHLYVTRSSASIAVVRIDASADLQRAGEVAAAASRLWRQENLDGRGLAEKVQQQERDAHRDPAIISFARTVEGIEAGAEQPIPQPLVDFALQHQLGEVSEPIQVGPNLWLAKVIDRVEGRNSGFDDPGVQAELRQKLEGHLFDHLIQVAVERARERTYIWRIERRR